MKKAFLIFIAFSTFACGRSSQNYSGKKSQTAKYQFYCFNDCVTDDSNIVFDDNNYPDECAFSVKVLATGTFHEDEVWEGAGNESWLGLFKGNKFYYLAGTLINTDRVYDVLDGDNVKEKTGWNISIDNTDTCLFLIEKLISLKEKTLQTISLSHFNLLPPDTFFFSFIGTDYRLYAVSGKNKGQFRPDWVNIYNYKLYIEASVNGQPKKSLLVARPYFDDNSIEIIFAGDIDGDKFLDLLIETSRHYNVSAPVLYLSSPAEKTELVKPVGQHRSVGC